jgi:hypothetical protein
MIRQMVQFDGQAAQGVVADDVLGIIGLRGDETRAMRR